MRFIRSKNFINSNHQVLMQLVAAFVSQSSCIQEFSLGLKNTLIIRPGVAKSQGCRA